MFFLSLVIGRNPHATFGGHVELIGVEDLAGLRNEVNREKAANRLQLFYEAFDVQADCPQEGAMKAAITSVALDRLVERYGLGSMACYYKGTGNAGSKIKRLGVLLKTDG